MRKILIAIAVFIGWNLLLKITDIVLDRIKKKQSSKFKAQLDLKCSEIVERVNQTKLTISKERETYKNLPPEIKEEFLDKYNEIEENCDRILNDVARIQTSCY